MAAGAVLLTTGGCEHSWRTDTFTPPIVLGAGLEARTSLPAVIALGDMELPSQMALDNSVYFVAVSRDRLRFHVTLRHKWEDMTDPTRWRVWIEDDLGRRFGPAAVDRRAPVAVTSTFEIGRPAEPSTDREYSFTTYRGQGDYEFYVRDLVRRDMRWLMLVMQRPGYEFRYRWSFVNDPDAPGPVLVPVGAQAVGGRSRGGSPGRPAGSGVRLAREPCRRGHVI